MNSATRFKLAVGCLIGFFLEALVKAFVPAFPLDALYIAQGSIIGYYYTVRTITGMQETKLGCKGPNETK